jgi:hypothetical protein
MRDRISKVSAIWYLCAFALVALVALVIGLATGLATDRAEPANANVGDITHVLWGDANCDNVVDVKDLLTTEQAMLGIPQDSNECGQDLQVGTRIVAEPAEANAQVAAINPGALRYQGYFGDTDCNGHVQGLDALANLKWIANLPVSQVVGCAPITFAMDVTEIQIGDITPPGPISQVAIDTETSGNAANSVGAIQDCLAPSNGGTFNVDIVAKGVPPFANFAGGLGGFDFVLVYDPSQLVITGINDQMMLAVGANNIVDYSENPPDTDGHFHVRAYDLSNNPESGNGVLARITLNAIGSGQSNLSLIAPPPARDGAPQIVDNENWIYPINSVDGALIRIDSACGTPTPTPSPTPIPTPTSTPGVGSNQCPSGSPIDIPDNDPIGVSDTKTLADAGTISSMAMCLDISTVWSGDLIATLTHVDTGSTITLFSRLGGSHTGADTCHNGIDTNIHVYLTDDEGAITESLEEACANGHPLDGTFPPVEQFATFSGPFNGESIAGDWKLTVSDNHEDGFTATIDGWQLYFNQ